jgi:hypothetical protein
MTHRFLAAVFVIALASAVNAQAPTGAAWLEATPFKVQVWGDLETDFSSLISRYFELRSTLERGVPALTVTDDPAAIIMAQRALAKKIRVARAGANLGAIFTPTITGTFKKVLIREMDDVTLAAVMDDNPGAFAHRINGTYPDEKPFATMPVNLLAALPRCRPASNTAFWDTISP